MAKDPSPIPSRSSSVRTAIWTWAIPLAAAGILAGAWGFEGLYGQDAHDYLHQAKEWRAWLLSGALPGFRLHPQFYPFLGAACSLLSADTLVALRLVSLLSLVITAYVIRTLLTPQADRPSVEIFIGLALFFSPFLLRHALFAMSDLLCLMLLVIGWAALVRSLNGRGPWHAFVLVLTLSLAVLTRLAAIAPAIAMLVVFFFSFLRRPSWKVAAAVTGAAIPITALCMILDNGPPMHHVAGYHAWLTDWAPCNFFRRSFDTVDGHARYALPNALHVLTVVVHPGFLPLGGALIFFFRRQDLRSLLVWSALLCAGATLFFLAGIPYQNDRFLLLAQPFVAIALFPAFRRAWSWGVSHRWRMGVLYTVLLCAQLALFARALHPFARMARTERAITSMVLDHPATRIYTFSLGPALRSYGVEMPIMDLSEAPVEKFEPGALLLFNPDRFAEQWRGREPMLNWQRAMDGHPSLLLAREDGWRLYRVR